MLKIRNPYVYSIFRPSMSASLPIAATVTISTTRYDRPTHWTAPSDA